jgi:hypothetical protein
MGSQLSESEIWAERQRDKGELLCPDYTAENVIVWCYPSKEAWETKIKPLIDKYSLEELTQLAGWLY